MKEFKGSKGPWFNDDGLIEDKKGREVCDVFSNCPTKKDLFNRQLISKSPEMLEMLQECYKYLPYEGVMRKKVERLIKQATEI